MRITELFLNTSLLAAGLLTVFAIALAKIKNALLWQRWSSWLAITIAFSSSYLISSYAFRIVLLSLCLVMVYEVLRAVTSFDSLIALVLVLQFEYFYQIVFGGSPTPYELWIPLAIILVILIGTAYENPAALGSAFLLLALLVVVVPLAVHYPDKFLALLLTVGCFDVAAYYGGKLIGSNSVFALRIFPKTSPNKTLAGVLLGTLVAAAALLILGHFTWIGTGLIVVGAVAGDYLESKFKRSVGVKDLGSWLPGFGGGLDRFDSILILAGLTPFIF